MTSTPAPIGTTAKLSTGAIALAPFFARAQALDTQLRAAAARVNRNIGTTTMTMDDSVVVAIAAIDVDPLSRLVPGGLGDDLLRATLLVYDDLSVRRAALSGYGHFFGTTPLNSREGQDLMRCLANGADPAAHFAQDLAQARALAAATDVTVAAPSSRAAADVAVRIALLRLGNVDCGACGAPVRRPVSLPPITWQRTAREGFDDPWDGTFQGVLFNATYVAGPGWQVYFNAC